MDPTCQPVRVLGRDDRVRGIGQVQNHHTVAAVGRPLTGQRGVASVGRDFHVVHRACIDLDGIGLDDVFRVRHIEDERVTIGLLGAHQSVVAPVNALEDPEVGAVDPLLAAPPHHLHRPHHFTLHGLEGAGRPQAPRPGHHGELARDVGHDAPALHLARRGGRDDSPGGHVGVAPLDGRVRDLVAIRVPNHGRERLHVPGAHRAFRATDNFEHSSDKLAHRVVDPAGHALEHGLDPDRTGRRPTHMTERVHLGAVRIAGPPHKLHAGAFGAVGVERNGLVGHRAALEDRPRTRHLDAHDGWPLHHDRHDKAKRLTARTRPHGRDNNLPFTHF